MAGKLLLLLAFCLVNLSVTFCWIFTDVSFDRVAARARNMEIQDVDFDMELELEEAALRINLIFPGTKWCGAGNIAENYDDLGPARNTDKCCREHDLCPEVIDGWSTMYNLTNEAIYTRLHCNCDETFRKCLRTVNSSTSNVIGTMYFNAIGTKCFREDYKVVNCTKKGGWLKKKCVEYSYNTTSAKIYQWFDVPVY